MEAVRVKSVLRKLFSAVAEADARDQVSHWNIDARKKRHNGTSHSLFLGPDRVMKEE